MSNTFFKNIVLVLLILSVFFVAGCTNPKNLNTDTVNENIKKINDSVVEIWGCQVPIERNPICELSPGFSFNDRGNIMTTYHTIKNNPYRYIVFSNGTRQAVPETSSLYAFSEYQDLAFLIIDTDVPKVIFENFTISESDMRNNSVGFIGFPNGVKIKTLAVGKISDIVRDSEYLFTVFKIEGSVYSGNSGSPVFLMDTGKVIGVLVKGDHKTNLTGFAIPLDRTYLDEFDKSLNSVDSR